MRHKQMQQRSRLRRSHCATLESSHKTTRTKETSAHELWGKPALLPSESPTTYLRQRAPVRSPHVPQTTTNMPHKHAQRHDIATQTSSKRRCGRRGGQRESPYARSAHLHASPPQPAASPASESHLPHASKARAAFVPPRRSSAARNAARSG